MVNLAAGTINRNQGGVLVFTAPQVTPLATNGIVITTSNSNDGGTGATAIMGGWAISFTQPVNAWTLAGTTVTNTQTAAAMGWATINTVSGAVGPLAPAGYTAANNGNNGGWAAANNADFTTAGNIIVAANSTVNSLRFNNSSFTGYTVTLSGGTNVVRTGGVLETPVAGANAVTINGPGALTASTAGAVTSPDLIVNQFNPFGTMTINAPITGAIGLTTAGVGNITLNSAASNYTGVTNISGTGTALFTNTGALPGFGTAGRVSVNTGTLAVSYGAPAGHGERRLVGRRRHVRRRQQPRHRRLRREQSDHLRFQPRRRGRFGEVERRDDGPDWQQFL